MNNIGNQIAINNSLQNNIETRLEQKNFLESKLGQVVNTAIDLGIRALLPDFIDEQVINLKNNLFENGLKEGISKTINDTLELGKSAIGIFTGNFENIEQIQKVVQSGGIIDGISSLFENVVNTIENKGMINTSTSNVLLKGKDIILNSIESNIEKNLNDQINKSNNIKDAINNWKDSFNNKNFEKMEKEYKIIEKQLKDLIPIEKTIEEARNIEILHNLIKNNGNNFDLSQEQIELISKLK